MSDEVSEGWFEESASEDPAESRVQSPSFEQPPYISVQADRESQNYVAGHDLTVETTVLEYGRIRSRPISTQDLAEATASFFVRPDEYSNMWQKLWDEGVLVLCGEPGSGRRTSALRLLSDCAEKLSRDGGQRMQLRKIGMGWEEISPSYISRITRRGYILDLTGNTDSSPEKDFAEDLLLGRRKLKESNVYLILMVTRAVWDNCRDSTDSFTFDVVAPTIEALITKRLETTAPGNVGILRDERVVALFRGLDLSGAADFASALSRVGDGEDGGVSLDQVLDEFRDWRAYLTSWFDRNQEVLDRATMITAAVLDPSWLNEIIQARDRLLKALAVQVEANGPLVGPGLSGFLRKLDAVQTDQGYSISLKRHRLDEAVLDFVWKEYPEARGPIEKWLLELTKRQNTPSSTILRISRVATGMSARLGGDRFLKVAEEILTKKTANRDLAIRMLDETVLDPILGHKVRARILKWSSSDDEALVEAAADLCAGSFGRERPRYAIFRLCRALSRTTPTSDGAPAIRACIRLGENATLRSEVFRSLLIQMQGVDSLGACRAFLGLMRVDGRVVVSGILRGIPDDEEVMEVLRDSWKIVCASSAHQSDIAYSLNDFLETLDLMNVPISSALEILTPALAANLRKSVVIPVLAGAVASGSGLRGNPVRTALLQHLIMGQSGKPESPQPEPKGEPWTE